LKTHRNK